MLEITFRYWIIKDPDTGEEFEPGEVSCEGKLPAKYGVCPKCDGHGKHLIDEIREHAYTPEDFKDDPDFCEEYQKGPNGMYGVTCTQCGGKRVVLEVDEKLADKELLEVYRKTKEDEARQKREDARTYRMEMGTFFGYH